MALAIFSILLTSEHFVFLSHSFAWVHDGTNYLTGPLAYASSWQEAIGSFWYPGSMAGVDKLSQPPFVPALEFVYFLLPIKWAEPLLVIFQAGTACCLTYLLCLRLGISKTGAIVSAILYALPYSRGFVVNGSFAFLPGYLLAMSVIDTSRSGLTKLLFGAVLGILFGLTITNFHTPFIVCTVILWLIFFDTALLRKIWIYVIFSLFSLAMIRLPALLAMIHNAEGSQRDLVLSASNSLHYISAFSLPTMMWNAVPVTVITLVAVLVFHRQWNFITLRMALGLLAIFLGVLIVDIGRISDVINIGFLKTLKLDTFYISATFFAAVMAGSIFGQIRISQNHINNSRSNAAFISIAVLILVCSSFVIVKDKIKHARIWLQNGSLSAQYSAANYAEISNRRSTELPFRTATTSWSSPAYVQGFGLDSADGYLNIYPARYFELWRLVLVPEDHRNNALAWSEENIPPTKSLSLQFTIPTETSDALEFEKLYNLDVLSLLNVKYIFSKKWIVASRLEPVFETPADWFKKTKPDKLMNNLKANFLDIPTIDIYRNKIVAPRFFVVSQVKIHQTKRDLLSALSVASISDLRDSAYFSGDDPDIPDEVKRFETKEERSSHPNSVEIMDRTYDEVSLRVLTDKPGILIWSSSYSRYWRAHVNGVEAKPFPVYHALTGLLLPGGTSKVEFSYDPPYTYSNLLRSTIDTLIAFDD
jgi:hypothetical protein